MEPKAIKLKAWAAENSFSYNGALKMFHRGDIEGAFQLPSGTILVPVSHTTQSHPDVKRACLYARVSTRKQQEHLQSQLSRLEAFATAQGFTISRQEQEIASGVNDNRAKLTNILNNPKDWDVLIVEHKDRLTRFGFEWLRGWVESHGNSIIVMNETTQGDDESLVDDLISVVASFTGRLYGKRGAKTKARKLVEDLSS